MTQKEITNNQAPSTREAPSSKFQLELISGREFEDEDDAGDALAEGPTHLAVTPEAAQPIEPILTVHYYVSKMNNNPA